MNRLIIFSFLWLVAFPAIAQTTFRTDRETLFGLYNKTIDGSAYLYTGAEYVIQSYPKIGSPFFLSDSMENGSIRYAGQLYKNIPLQWDVLQNYVLTRSLNGYSKIILQNNLIDSFTIGDHTIIKLKENKAANLYNSDFYDVLFSGTIQVFARRSKQTSNTIKDERIIYHFNNKDKFYIQKNGIFYRVSNKREVMRVLAAQASAVNRAVRKQGLNWRKNFETSLITAAQQYDQLTH